MKLPFKVPRFPIPFGWLWGYNFRRDFLFDLLAGLTVGTMLIPQGLAYAKLANLTPIVGLYSSFVPILIYAALGKSPHLALGPVALVSLLVGEAVEAEAELRYPGMDPLAEDGVVAAYRIEVAQLLALISGAVLLLLGLLSAGPVLNFLSHPVLAGFTSAAAFIIGASQLKHMFQIDVPSDSVPEKIVDVFSRTDDWNGWAIFVTLLALTALLTLRYLGRVWPKIKLVPGVVLVVVISIIVTWTARLDKSSSANLKIVGVVPSGVDIAALPNFDWDVFQRVALEGVLIGLVGFLEAASVGKAFATKFGYELDANQELFAVGGANVVGAFFTAYPTTGGFSRTAVNAVAGARTQLGSLVSAIFILFTLLVLTPLFEYLPNAVLAAVILSAVVSLVEIKEARHLWHVSKPDFVVMAVTFVVTLVFGIEIGLLVAVAFSLAVFIKKSAAPHSAILGRLPDSKEYRNIHRFSGLKLVPGVLVWRMDAPLFFGNTEFFFNKIKALALRNHASDHDGSTTASTVDSVDSAYSAYSDDSEAADRGRTELPSAPTRALVLDMSSVTSVDASGMEVLVEAFQWLKDHRILVAMSMVRGPVRDMLRNPASGFDAVFDLDSHSFYATDDAVKFVRNTKFVSSDSDPSSETSTDSAMFTRTGCSSDYDLASDDDNSSSYVSDSS